MPRSTTDTCEVFIAGLGAMGSAAAWQLASRGRRVIGCDRFHPPHTFGSSTGKSRIIREAYWESPAYVPIVRRAYELWEQLERDAGQVLLRRTGGLVIGPEAGALVSGAIRSARAHGVPFEELSAAEVRRRSPALQPDDSLVAVLEPRAGVLAPEAAISAMLAEAARLGAELRFEEAVLEWKPAGDGVRVRTTRGVVTAGRLILAAGAWMHSELPGVRLPLTVQRQVMGWLPVPPGNDSFGPGRLPVWLWETHEGAMWYGFPDLGEGAKVARHQAGELTSADGVDRDVGERDLGPLRQFVASALPALTGPVQDARVCLYTNTPDQHFLLDRHPECAAVILASPCSGHGFKFATAIGEILTDLAMDRTPATDLAPFALSRFTTS
jgi:sarcosine oxidase